MLKDHIEEAQKLAKEIVSDIINEYREIGEASDTSAATNFKIEEDEYDEFIEMLKEELDEFDYLNEEDHCLDDGNSVKKYTHIAINGMYVEIDDDAEEDEDPHFFVTVEYAPVYRYVADDGCGYYHINERIYEKALATGELPESIDDDDDDSESFESWLSGLVGDNEMDRMEITCGVFDD